MPSVRVNGVDLAYDDAGSGPAVVLVHGALGDRRMWDHRFAAGEFAHHADLLALLDALGIERAALAGNSDGGAYAVDVALAAPERVTSLALMAVGPDREPSDLDPGVWDRAVRMCRLVFEREWTGPASTELGARPPAKGRLHEVAAPTLVVNGRADLSYVQDVSDLLSDGIPGAERVDMDDTGHLPPLERPAEVTALLRDFFAGTAQAG